MEKLWQDLRYSLRKLINSPAFFVVVVFSLALGIGGNVTIFSLMNATLFRELPQIKEPNRLVWVFTSNRLIGNSLPVSYADYLDFKSQNQVFSGLAAFDGEKLSLNTGGESVEVRGEIVSGNFFSLLGVEAARGRVFREEEEKTAQPVAILSHGLWERRFGADPNVVGKTVNLNGVAFTIIGVMPKEFVGTEVGLTPDLWVPIYMFTQLQPPQEAGTLERLYHRDFRRFKVWGRLKPDASVEQAQTTLTAIAAQLEQANPTTNRRMSVNVMPISGGIDPRDRADLLPAAGLLLAIVGLVLVIACVNVVSLLLTRAATRQKEIAIRLALGASRARLVRQLLTESLVLFVCGGATGLFLSYWATGLLLALAPTDKSIVIDSVIDYRMYIFTLLLSLITGIIFGLAPALQASKPNLIPALKNEVFRPSTNRRRPSLRNIFLIAQVALSIVLLVCAGLFVRSLQNAKSIDPGFTVENALVVPVNLKLQRYSETNGRDFFQRLVQRVGATAGVKSVSLARFVPLGFSASGKSVVTVEGREPSREEAPTMIGSNLVGQNYFQTMGIPIVRGRDFSSQDTRESPGVIIINETTARRLWPTEDPIGKRLSLSGTRGPYLEVIGVAKDSKYESLGETAQPHLYQSAQQEYDSNMYLLVRTASDPKGLLETVRQQLLEMDKNLPTTEVGTLSDQVSRSLYPARAAAWLLGSFGALALILAAVGLYGMLSYSVSQRTKEIGVRMALGAEPRNVISLVLREGMKLLLIGAAIGLVLAFAVTRLLSNFVFGVSATDPLTFTIVPLVLTLAALIACYIPALRATRVDPMIAIRAE